MAAKLSPEILLAKALVNPYSPPTNGRGQSLPLSWRALPEGGMVVVAGDGRKLWFNAEEVQKAQEELQEMNIREEKKKAAEIKRVPVKLAPPPPEPIKVNSGKAVSMVINKDQFKDL